MNQFLNSHRQEFKEFVDAVCAISPDRSASAIPPSYATPITILGRLPPTSREGFPSLPYLIDQARECAALVNLWLDVRNNIESGTRVSDELKRFDALCQQSRQKTRECLNLAEQAERPSGFIEPKWEELVEQMGRKARLRSESGKYTTYSRIADRSHSTANSSTSSLGGSHVGRNTSHPDSPIYNTMTLNRTGPPIGRLGVTEDPGSSGEEETETPPGSSSAVWDSGVMRRDEETMSTLAVKDDDEDSVELPETVIGSSMYSLGSNPANKLAKPPRSSAHHHRKRDKTKVKSAYCLDKPLSTDRPTSGKGGSASRSLGGSQGQAHRERAASSSAGKSLYRLKDLSVDAGRRSPASRDGGGGILDFGALFKRRAKEKEDGWKG